MRTFEKLNKRQQGLVIEALGDAIDMVLAQAKVKDVPRVMVMFTSKDEYQFVSNDLFRQGDRSMPAALRLLADLMDAATKSGGGGGAGDNGNGQHGG